MIEDARFPIGKFDVDRFSDRHQNIGVISQLSTNLRIAVGKLGDAQLDTPYREGGWTLRQTVHHIADSHINSFCRFKLALTEDVPTIRPYHEDLWAELSDSRLSIEPSLQIIDGVHTRWTTLLKNMTEADFARELLHPDSGKWTLEEMLGLYAWHSLHHLTHITSTCERNEWILSS